MPQPPLALALALAPALAVQQSKATCQWHSLNSDSDDELRKQEGRERFSLSKCSEDLKAAHEE